jgi:ATP-dependent DNA helicase RecG
MPAGRKSVRTHLTKDGNEHRVYDTVKRELRSGSQAYFVFPVIEGGTGDLKDVEGMYRKFETDTFRDFRIGMIHSRVSEEGKRTTMEAFAEGRIDILIATSVVEVGVDVPNATCMVIEHADRFGLSALHQLRGRIGRGAKQSYAFLVYSRNLTDDAVKRLTIMMKTTDGFRIAEEDLRIRGPGELLGTRQSGFIKLNLADLSRDGDLLREVRRDVEKLVGEDRT